MNVTKYEVRDDPIFTENFSTYGTGPNGLPENWTTDWWKWVPTYYATGDPNLAGEAMCYYKDQENGYDYYDNNLTSPKINATGLEKVYLEFAALWRGYSSYNCYMYLKYRKNSTSPWKDVTPWSVPLKGTIGDWYKILCYDFEESNLGPEFQFKFDYVGYYYYFRNWYIDECTVTPCSEEPEYAELIEDITISAGEEKQVSFPPWTPSGWQNESTEDTYEEYTVSAEIFLDGDQKQSNNFDYKLVELYFPWMDDVASIRVAGPESGPAQTFEVDGIINNYGQNEECCFKTYIEVTEKGCTNPEYEDSMCVSKIIPQQEMELEFDDWTPAFLAEEITGQKTYLVKMWTALEDPPDRNPGNDIWQRTIILDFFHDVGVREITSPVQPNFNRDEIWFYQRCYKPNEPWGFYTSSTGLGYLCQEDWYDVTKPIGRFGATGLTLIYPWSQCDPEGMEFELIIYEPGSSPGEELYVYSDVLPRIRDTGLTYGSYGNAYEVQFDPVHGKVKPVNMEEGWLSVQSTYSPNNCNFCWLSSPDGNNNARQNGNSLSDNLAINLSLCFCCTWGIYIKSGIQDISAIVQNIGTFPEYDMTCYTEIYEYISDCKNGTLVYEDNITDIDLLDPLGGWEELIFGDYNFWTEGHFQLIVNLSDDNDDSEQNNILSLDIGVDDTPPTASHSVMPDVPDGKNGYYVNDVEVRLRASDPDLAGGCNISGSGIDRIEYRIDGGSWGSVPGSSGTFTMSTDGNDVLIEYRSVDNVGNVEDINSFTLDMDQTVPVAEEIAWYAYKEDGIWKVDLTASAVDATSGMDRVEFFLLGEHHETIEGAGPEYVFTIDWSESLRGHFGYFYHYDRAGNVVEVIFPFEVVVAVPHSQSYRQLLNPINRATYTHYNK